MKLRQAKKVVKNPYRYYKLSTALKAFQVVMRCKNAKAWFGQGVPKRFYWLTYRAFRQNVLHFRATKGTLGLYDPLTNEAISRP